MVANPRRVLQSTVELRVDNKKQKEKTWWKLEILEPDTLACLSTLF